MSRIRLLANNRGATSLVLIIGIITLIVTIGLSAYWLARSETTESLLNRSTNDSYFVSDSGRRVAERCFQQYMVGSVKQNIQSPEKIAQVEAIAKGTDPVQFLALGGLPLTKVWSCPTGDYTYVGTTPPSVCPKCATLSTKFTYLSGAQYRVDLGKATVTNNLVVSTGARIWNRVGPDRDFDAVITVQRGDVPISDASLPYWGFPLSFKIEVIGRAPIGHGKYSHNTVIGRGTVTLYVNKVTKRSYADNLEFTEEYISRHGTPFMRPADSYDGPVHTSGTFYYKGNPGTLFKAAVYTSQSVARFWDTTKSVWGESNKEFYPPTAKKPDQYIVYPQFKQGYIRSVSVEPLPDTHPNFLLDVLSGQPEPGPEIDEKINVYLPTAGASTVSKGGIYVLGDCDIELRRVDDNGVADPAGANQEFVFTHYSSTSGAVLDTSRIWLKFATNEMFVTDINEITKTYTPIVDLSDTLAGPQIALYVRGRVRSLRGALARETQLSIYAKGRVGSTDDITITGDINYAAEPNPVTDPSPPNILGLMAESGDVAVTCTTTDVYIDAHIMTFMGEFYCTNWSGAQKGKLKLYGSIASHRAGLIGGDSTGYAKDYTWDSRATFAPPPLWLTYKSLYTVIMERPDTTQSTWRVIWANENL